MTTIDPTEKKEKGKRHRRFSLSPRLKKLLWATAEKAALAAATALGTWAAASLISHSADFGNILLLIWHWVVSIVGSALSLLFVIWYLRKSQPRLAMVPA